MGTLVLAEWALGSSGLDSLVDGPTGSSNAVFGILQSDEWAASSAATLSRHETSSQPGHAHLAADLIRRSRGTRLPTEVAARLSAALGTDISDAVIHTDSAAAQAAAAVNAHAFATGRDVFFGAGEYKPGTREGDELLAHELTHVVQDSEGRIPQASGEGLTVSSPSDSHEREAETAGREAMDVLHGGGDVGMEGLEMAGTNMIESETESQHTSSLNTMPMVNRQASGESGGGTATSGDSLSHRIAKDALKGLIEAFIEKGVPPAKIVFMARDLGMAFADGVGKGLEQANAELLATYREYEMLSDEDLTESGAINDMRKWQAKNVGKLPDILKEGLCGVAESVAKGKVAEFIGSDMSGMFDSALKQAGVNMGDIVGDFLTGDYPQIMGRELIGQTAEDMVEGATNYATEQVTEAFFNATASEMVSSGLTELETAWELTDELGKDEASRVVSSSGGALQISAVGRSVKQKLDSIKSQLKASATGKPWEDTYREFLLSYNSCALKYANLQSMGAFEKMYSSEDERRIKEIREDAQQAKFGLDDLCSFHVHYSADLKPMLDKEYDALNGAMHLDG
jgi:hypothetical protein